MKTPMPFSIAPDVYGLDLGLLGLEEYGAGYIVRGKEGVALVEVGTSLCVPRLLAGLEALGIAPEEVTHILCTHIHLDHAGAAGHLLEHLPRARVAIHSRDHRHLAQPARLLESVAQAVGTLFPLYGEVRPIPLERLLPGEELHLDLGGGVYLESIPTPGHSRDHLAYFLPHLGLLFPGDAAGVSLFEHRFSRPVTVPPAFDPLEMLHSLEVLRALRPSALCFTHFGRHDDPEAVFDGLEKTLRRWDELARTVGVEVAGDAVFAANLPPPGSEPASLWQAIAEMNRRGFIQAYRSDERAR